MRQTGPIGPELGDEMEKVIVVVFLFFAGCGWNKTVSHYTKDICLEETDTGNCKKRDVVNKWQCKLERPLFFFDSVYRICDTAKECSDYCFPEVKK